MSAKTKIVVLRMKELLYTGLFILLGVVLIVLLLTLFRHGKENSSGSEPPAENNPSASDAAQPSSPASSDSIYIPGVYSTQLVLQDQTVDIEVIVDSSRITSIRMVNLNETVAAMYPLLTPVFDSLCRQIYEKQSLEGITYESESKYTSLVLLQAVKSALEKAAANESKIQ